MADKPVLVVLGGLPGSGKTTLARELARAVRAVHVDRRGPRGVLRPREHRRRVEERVADIPGHRQPTWSDTASRRLDAWPEATVVDAGRNPSTPADEVRGLLD